MRNINLQNRFSKFTVYDIRESKDREFYMWSEQLQQGIQELYDKVMLPYDDEISDIDINKQAKLDLIFYHIEDLIEQGKRLLEKEMK